MSKKTLRQLYAEHTGKVSDKWSLYLNEYDRLFDEYRDKPTRLLEIGIQNGGSLEIWSKYFSNPLALVGCDINQDCSRLSYDAPHISVVVGDANIPEVKSQVLLHSPQFEIIIDDGSHLSSDIVKSFALYFPYLVEGGVFIAEDLHCSYWGSFEGGLFDPHSSISFFKRLADVINHEHWGIPKARADILHGIFTKYGCEVDTEALSQVHSVEFINSMCVVRKASIADNCLGQRIIAGSMELVVSGHQKLHGVPYRLDPLFDQSGNPWTARTAPPDEAIEQIELELTETKHQNSVLEQQNSELNLRISCLHNSSSWRITMPLRIVEHQIKRIRHVVKLAVPAIKLGGGLKNTSKKAMQLYQREGLAGIKRGFRKISASVGVNPTLGSDGFDRNDYVEWIRRYDTITEETRTVIRANIESFLHKPLISVVMPTYNPKPEWLEEAIESVRKQIYPHWELCIADDASTNTTIRPILERYVKEDQRIKVIFREHNGHISASSNSALALATGDWVALLDHDDLLTEHALFHLADMINKHPDSQMIYSDEDKISADGRRFEPYFKPDWNIDLFYSQNLFSHLGAYESKLLNQVGGFRIGFEGSQDYDLALRCIEQIKSTQIKHIPHVLYHWRIHPESTASSNSAKPYVVTAAERALNEHFKRLSINATTEAFVAGYKVNYHLPTPSPLVSLLIRFNDTIDSVIRCVNSIEHHTSYPNYEIIIVPTSTTTDADIRTVTKLVNNNILKATVSPTADDMTLTLNDIVDLANGELICFMDAATEAISPSWLTEMVSVALQPQVGAVGSKLLDTEDRVYSGGILFNTINQSLYFHAHKGIHRHDYGYFGRASLRQNYLAISPSCALIRKKIYIKNKGLNKKEFTKPLDWFDLCLRIKESGYRITWTPFSEVRIHQITESINSNQLNVFNSKWHSSLNTNYSNNPNLSNNTCNFSLVWWPSRFNKN